MKCLVTCTASVAMGALLIISDPGTLWAAEDHNKVGNNVWVSLGLHQADIQGETEKKTFGRGAAHFSVTRRAFLTVSFARHQKIELMRFGPGKPKPKDTFNEFAVMIGMRALAQRLGYASVSVGLAAVSGKQTVEYYDPQLSYRSEPWSGVGLPLEVQFVLTPVRYVGLGVGAHANFNSDHSFTGATFSLLVGQIW
jgi:hypothetical protein